MPICKECMIKENRGVVVLGVVVLNAFTSWTCEKCGKEFMNAKSDTSKVCPECSEKHEICERCGREFGYDEYRYYRVRK